MTKHYFTFLTLGDSYTIGESVALHESFPYQVIQILRNDGLHFHAPEIIAKTGWTSFELAEHLLHTQLNEQYDFVTLLVGVNNQYRGIAAAEFAEDFNFLLRKAIHLSGEKPDHVIVLSIPDWGVTPFAKDKNGEKIAKEIGAFNKICESAAKEMQAHFINITEDTRKAKDDPLLLAPDSLHYSEQAHAVWAEKATDIIKQLIRK
jgi:lysophospholipase L1-like esterase